MANAQILVSQIFNWSELCEPWR